MGAHVGCGLVLSLEASGHHRPLQASVETLTQKFTDCRWTACLQINGLGLGHTHRQTQRADWVLFLKSCSNLLRGVSLTLPHPAAVFVFRQICTYAAVRITGHHAMGERKGTRGSGRRTVS